MPPFAEPTGQIDDSVDADELLKGIEGPSSERPMGGGDEPAAPAAPAPEEKPIPQIQPAPAPIPAVAELEFDYNGKLIKAPYTDPRIKTWAQQGYDYSQKMAAFNEQKAQFEKQAATYRTIDEYAKSNPEWWAHVEQAWKTREQSREQGRSDETLPTWAKQKLQELDQIKPFIDELKQDREKQRIEMEDSQLAEEMKSIREKYPNLDWASADERGQSKLERQVLEHAVREGIKSYRTAFRDYYHENLVKLEQERGKEQVTKDLQKRAKLGIIGESPTPTKAMKPAEGVKNKSYESLLDEVKAEFGIA